VKQLSRREYAKKAGPVVHKARLVPGMRRRLGTGHTTWSDRQRFQKRGQHPARLLALFRWTRKANPPKEEVLFIENWQGRPIVVPNTAIHYRGAGS
jgi:hypothetical protein